MLYNPATGSTAIYSPNPRITASLAQAQVLHNTFWCDYGAFIDYADREDMYAFATTDTARLLDEPRNYADAMKSPNAAASRAARDEEIQCIHEKGVWHIVPCPPNRNVIKGAGCLRSSYVRMVLYQNTRPDMWRRATPK